ncbi:MAG: molybdopterin-dependent oxidoreductase [Dehalococcoidales bacterium]|nr:molybdopterin-dependent oxidoreductase [Dehalococcoidales bacterium]
MASAKTQKVDVRPDKTVIRALALGGLLGGGGECAVDVKDGKIVRIRPFHYDWKYDPESFRPWKVTRNGKTYRPLFKSVPGPYSLAYKKRAYSPNRIKYPLIRVDWDPNGERNPQNRGKSKYRRISWDEATTIIANEIRRIHKQYGPLAIMVQGDGHGECKTINTPHGHSGRLFDMMGGFTQQVRNPDSWEGWYWGSKHVWGQGIQGMMDPSANLLKDIVENADMILFWGCDPERTPWAFDGQMASRLCYWWSEIGIKSVYICPDLNYGAAVHADKWIPVLPNTDAALQLAIIYVWLTEGTYKKDYVATHAVGMDKVADYVLGKEDGIPKTPEWASKKCGVPEWTIKALAREWAKKTTSIAHYFGGSYVRGPFSHEPGRLEVILLGMQGLGGPGVHQWQITYTGMPRAEGLRSTRFFNPQLSERLTKPVATTIRAWGKQLIPKTWIQQAIENPPLTFYGSGAIEIPTEDQFVKYTYPIDKEKGGTEIHMIWTDTPCRLTCWNHGNWTVEAFRNPKIECVVAQHPWLENDCLLADIILPSNTTFEVEDIVTNVRQGVNFHSIAIMEQAIHPIGESKSDYEVVLEVAKKLGLGEKFSENKTTYDLQKQVFDDMEIHHLISWEEFYNKKYFVFPTAKDWENDPPGFRKFYEDPKKNPLKTPSGLLEFSSERLAKHFPDDKERPPIPKWIEKSETHDERISSERAKMFPLLLMSNHGRWRTHAQGDDISWTREVPTCKVLGKDGYKYEPVWINPVDAEKRGIKDGDIVKVFNERGIVLCGARVWERVRPGVAYVDHGARYDPIIPGWVDRGGAINTIAPYGVSSRNAVGQATSGYLVDVQKVTEKDYEEWRKMDPEAFDAAFKRPYDPASGLRFDAWVVDEDCVESIGKEAK